MQAPSHSTDSVYIITHEFYPKRGGIATFTEEIAKATSDLGRDVEVWAQNRGRVKANDGLPARTRTHVNAHAVAAIPRISPP